MSLNDTLDALVAFRTSLVEFIDVLRTSEVAQARSEDQLGRVWDDEFQRDFERRYAELSQPVSSFTRVEAERMLQFLDSKIQTLRRYLHDAH